MSKFHLDFETRSTLDIKKVGAWKYAMHPSTEITCLSYAFERGQKPVVLTAEGIKRGYFRAAVDLLQVRNRVISAHSAHFEYAIYNYIMHKRHGYPALWAPNRWSCTLARAAACGLPASLDHLGVALGIEMKKDLAGRAAMLKLCKPGADGTYNEDPALYALLYPYCQRDVEAEMEIDALLPELTPGERAIWELDLRINHRGVQTDPKLAEAAAYLAGEITTDLNQQLAKLTNGAVDSASRVAAIKAYLKTQGVEVEGLDKQAVSALLKDPSVSPHVKKVVAIRRQVGKSSTAKYTATVNAASSVDNRVRGVLQYHAAATGRWGGRLIQPQNYPQGFKEKDQKAAISAILDRDASAFSLFYGDQAMETLSGSLRGTIIAAPGKRLLAADYNAIEARVLFWEAGDTAALSMYARGESPYVDMARAIYKDNRIEQESHPEEYNMGKRVILGCGYQMGAERFMATCAQYGADISIELASRAVKAYREKYTSVVNLWYSTERAAVNAVKNPGSVHGACGNRAHWGMDKKREFLVCKLPSGRFLRYYHPAIRVVDSPYGEKEQIHYWAAGINGSLEEFKTYGGSLVENITQAIARDIMANGMVKCEAAGYPLVLTVHDEIIAERTLGEGSIEGLIKAMCDLPDWARGCPIAAKGWEGQRYRK